MFQSFSATGRPDLGPPRLTALRARMRAAGLDGFLVPRADAHQGEYVAPRDERLAWLTGFTGSAGICVVLADQAGVFIDGRYTLQVRDQVDLGAFTPLPWPETRPETWAAAAVPGGTIGYDPWLHTAAELARYQAQGLVLRATENLIDAIWPDQPAPPCGGMRVHPLHLAGRSHEDKRADLAAVLRAAGQRACVLSLPDSIAWLLNIRGSDIARNPVPHAFALVHDTGAVDLFCAPAKLDGAMRAHLGPGVTPHPPEALLPALAGLRGAVRIDRDTAPQRLVEALAEPAFAPDPCILPKARKTAAELDGMRAAHLRDGLAMVRFLHWVEGALAAPAPLTEIGVVRALEQFRRADPNLRDISFDTIAGSGPHGAIVHYRVTEATDRPIVPGDLLLVDSGGQYEDGTTDITRTLATGPVPPEARAAFTRVLRGMIAVSRLRWPVGLAGRHLDAVARMPLWLAGQDYDHGTGHGVGAALSVHEGPQRLSRVSDVALEPGMILSNEPGYYRTGAFGIRIENLVVVTPAPDLPGADVREMLAFETLTLAPIDRRLIDADALPPEERAWCDAYHARVYQTLAPHLPADVAAWLARATAPL